MRIWLSALQKNAVQRRVAVGVRVRRAGVTLYATGVRGRGQVHKHDVRGQAYSHNNTGMMCPYAGIIQIRYGRMQASLSAYLAVSSLLLE